MNGMPFHEWCCHLLFIYQPSVYFAQHHRAAFHRLPCHSQSKPSTGAVPQKTWTGQRWVAIESRELQLHHAKNVSLRIRFPNSMVWTVILLSFVPSRWKCGQIQTFDKKAEATLLSHVYTTCNMQCASKFFSERKTIECTHQPTNKMLSFNEFFC